MWIPSLVVSYRTALTGLVALAVIVGVSACSSADSTPPVGSVAVTAARSRVAIGGPLELTYRFELTGAPITGDYNVFVHLLNADGQVLWHDDHRPSVPTSAWKAGTPVEYTRTVFLPPAQLHPGDATVEVGLYRDSERLVLEGPRPPRDQAARAYPVVDLQLAPESENVFLIYQNGWHPDEFGADNPARSWKWTQKSATVAFRNPKADADVLVEFGARPQAFVDAPQQLSVIGANDELIAAFPVDASEAVQQRFRVTAAQMGTGDLAELRFEVDKTFVPAEQGGGQDTRILGVRIYNVYVDVR